MFVSLNLILRFVLEITMLVITGIWGWNQTTGLFQYFLAIGMPVLFAGLWGIFAVRNDPSRSGKTIVQTPGIIRLIMELVLFGFACWALYDLKYTTLFYIMAAIVFIHYVFSIKRIRWLLKQK